MKNEEILGVVTILNSSFSTLHSKKRIAMPVRADKDLYYRLRHSAAHVMAEAVLELFPDAKLAIGPPIEDGFYYDFDLPRPLTPDDLAAIEDGMRTIIAGNYPF